MDFERVLAAVDVAGSPCAPVTATRKPDTATVQALRRNLRETIARVRDGGGSLIVEDRGTPVAVIIGTAEAARRRRIERSLAVLHDLDIYPELAIYVGELPTLIVNGARHLAQYAAGEVVRRPREILTLPRSGELAQVWDRLDDVLRDVQSGQPWLVIDVGREAVLVLGAREAERLRAFERIVNWFQEEGLDLAEADPQDINAFVRRFRTEHRDSD